MIKQNTPIRAKRDIRADSATKASPILSPRVKHTVADPLELVKERYSSGVQVVPFIALWSISERLKTVGHGKRKGARIAQAHF